MTAANGDDTLSHQSNEETAPNPTPMRLWVLRVAHHPHAEFIGQSIPLLIGAEATYGRYTKESGRPSTNHDPIFNDPDISRDHIKLRAHCNYLHMVVLSKNRVKIGTHRVMQGQEAQLYDGNVLYVATQTTPILFVVRNTFMSDAGVSVPNLVSASAEMDQVKQRMEVIAKQNRCVLIRGETGTGKELVARGIHEMSPRSTKPYVTTNCGKLRGDRFVADLFGYVKGAFTGADKENAGLAKQAEGGTLFLDEIGELDPNIQAKLLRFVQFKEIEPLGGTVSNVNVRIVCASHANFEERIEQGTYREDLYRRLDQDVVRIPALRDRMDDVPVLARHFVKQELGAAKPIDHRLMLELLLRAWSGNVRALENVMLTAIAHTAELPAVTLSRAVEEKLAQQPYHPNAMERRSGQPLVSTPIRVEHSQPINKETALGRLHENNGNKRKTAAELGIARATLYRWLGKKKSSDDS